MLILHAEPPVFLVKFEEGDEPLLEGHYLLVGADSFIVQEYCQQADPRKAIITLDRCFPEVASWPLEHARVRYRVS